MFTDNDVVFCILHSCVDGIRSDRLVYYMYAYQKAGLNLKYRYRVQVHGISCSDITAVLNSLITQNKLVCEKGQLILTDEGYRDYDNVSLTLKEWELINGIKSLFDKFSREELFFICVSDIVVNDMLRRSGVDGLRSGRATVESAIRNLTTEFSEENFDTALSIMRQLSEGVVV